ISRAASNTAFVKPAEADCPAGGGQVVKRLKYIVLIRYCFIILVLTSAPTSFNLVNACLPSPFLLS
ncbi:MAG: hypothetical protein P8X55_15195, partial [Desulfosarcinaceae bacterium]